MALLISKMLFLFLILTSPSYTSSNAVGFISVAYHQSPLHSLVRLNISTTGSIDPSVHPFLSPFFWSGRIGSRPTFFLAPFFTRQRKSSQVSQRRGRLTLASPSNCPHFPKFPKAIDSEPTGLFTLIKSQNQL
jgi:hypothetical protein